jgi:MoaA/NifB/PqqE/SkfB family radical SAM enzyme
LNTGNMARNLYVNLGIRFLRERFKPRDVLPMKLTVASTFQCNHQCRICNIWRIYRENPDQLRQELTPEDYGRIFDEVKKGLLFLDWGGGEPFLRKDMPLILQEAARICPKLSSFVITTNGFLPERCVDTMSELAGTLKGHRFSVGVSLDGDEQTHDNIRGREGAFRKAVETIRQLSDLGRKHRNIEAKVSYTLCSLNHGRFRDFHKEVLKELGLGVGDVGFNLEHVGNLFQTDSNGRKTIGEIGMEQFREDVRRDIAYALEHTRSEKLPALQRLKSFYRTFFLEEIPGYLEDPGRMVVPCMAGRNSLYLDPYGNLYPCVVWGMKLGNVADGVEAVLRGNTTEIARRTIEKGKCPICWNACEVIPSLLTSWRLAGCMTRSLAGR